MVDNSVVFYIINLVRCGKDLFLFYVFNVSINFLDYIKVYFSTFDFIFYYLLWIYGSFLMFWWTSNVFETFDFPNLTFQMNLRFAEIGDLS